MNKKNTLILAIVLIAVLGILGMKFYGNTEKPLNAPAFVAQSLTEHKPLWLLFRSQT